MDCPNCKINYRLYKFIYYRDAMPETGHRWVRKENYDRAIGMNTRCEQLRDAAVSNAKARYLKKAVQDWSELSKKELWIRLKKGLRQFSALGTFYKHTNGMERYDYIADLFQYNQLAELLTAIGVKDQEILDQLEEATRLQKDADKLLRGY